MAALAVAEMRRFGDCWCTSKALAVITASALCSIHGWHRAQMLGTLVPANVPNAQRLAAPVVAELSQFSNRWCTRTAGPAVVATVDSDSTHHSVVGAVTMAAFFRLTPASNRGLISS
ncbi:hypothetical protein K439DRAFT_1612018 [Ramaria rubella]|nr:hypothetical protein K439DRAFT_1612018 [Ramaria rubella]